MKKRKTLLLFAAVLLIIPGLLWAADRPGLTLAITKASPKAAKSLPVAQPTSESSGPKVSGQSNNSSENRGGVGNTPETSGNETILEFKTMVGVDGPFLGSDNPIRGVNGGGAPWVLDLAHGHLKANGDLDILVKGLIIPNLGINPADFFLAIVSCLTVDEFGVIVEENISTVQADTQMIGNPENGDAHIRANVNLPDPCVAPIIFVTSPTGSWFASTGAGVIPPPAP